MDDATRTKIEAYMVLEKQLAAVLVDRPPKVVGAALAQMVAFYLLGHHPDVREGMAHEWFDLLQKLIELDTARADAVHHHGASGTKN